MKNYFILCAFLALLVLSTTSDKSTNTNYNYQEKMVNNVQTIKMQTYKTNMQNELTEKHAHETCKRDKLLRSALFRQQNDALDISKRYFPLKKEIRERNWNQSVLDDAIQNNRLSVVKVLVGNGCQISNLGIAAKCGNVEMVQYLVEHGAIVNEKIGWYSQSPLFEAVSRNSETGLKVVQYLLNQKADVDFQTRSGETALHLTALNSGTIAIETMKLLLERMANTKYITIDVKDRCTTSEQEERENVQAYEDDRRFRQDFLEPRRIHTHNGMTALMIASALNNVEQCELLIKCSADINALDWNGNSVLELAYPKLIWGWKKFKFYPDNGPRKTTKDSIMLFKMLLPKTNFVHMVHVQRTLRYRSEVDKVILMLVDQSVAERLMILQRLRSKKSGNYSRIKI